MGCQRCPLRKNCQQVVFGDDHHFSRLMVIGSHPHPTPQHQTALFKPEEALELYQAMDSVGIIHLFPKTDYGPLTYGFIGNCGVYLTTVVKCPPSGRHPTVDEIRACLPWLGRQIGVIKPRVIVAMGNVAFHALTATPLHKCRITKERGNLFLAKDKQTLVIATHDPGYVLHWRETHHKEPEKARDELRADLKRAWEAVCKLG